MNVDAYARYLLPDVLFSDDRGLEVWRPINAGDTYYQTDDEIELLQTHAASIAEHIDAGTNIVDLGCG